MKMEQMTISDVNKKKKEKWFKPNCELQNIKIKWNKKKYKTKNKNEHDLIYKQLSQSGIYCFFLPLLTCFTWKHWTDILIYSLKLFWKVIGMMAIHL